MVKQFSDAMQHPSYPSLLRLFWVRSACYKRPTATKAYKSMVFALWCPDLHKSHGKSSKGNIDTAFTRETVASLASKHPLNKQKWNSWPLYCTPAFFGALAHFLLGLDGMSLCSYQYPHEADGSFDRKSCRLRWFVVPDWRACYASRMSCTFLQKNVRQSMFGRSQA